MGLGPKTDNRVSDGDGNTLVGQNAGTITIGYSAAEHQAALEKALGAKEQDLERAHQAERALLQNQINTIRERLAHVEEDHARRLEELVHTRGLLARFDNQLDAHKREAAYAALNAGETTLAEALLKELAAKARARRDDAAREESAFEFELGKLAEADIRWPDAAGHYAQAARLDPTYDTLVKAGEFLWRAGRHGEAMRCEERLVEIAKARFGRADPKTATALNNLAASYRGEGRHGDAEALYREVLAIDREAGRVQHPDHARSLDNLASLLQATGRTEEAEPLYREALGIDRDVQGARHPDYAQRLNNLAAFLQASGRLGEAEPLYLEALEIGRETLGPDHPPMRAV